jgi:hypothetical protein
MGKAEKRIQKWRHNPPQDAPVDEVEAVLKRYFAGSYEQKTGSHFFVKDKRLRGTSEFGPLGAFQIPVSGGQKVRKEYLKRLATAVEIIIDLESE